MPQVNPNLLARLSAKVVAAIPSDMAVELRAIPVSIDGDNNLTVAMSDPSDRHAVDEIGFFTGAYIVRAVATQMQIAWCLAHYYGHVTALGQRLMQPTATGAAGAVNEAAAVPLRERTKGLTGKVEAARHRAMAPVTSQVQPIRPRGAVLDNATIRAQSVQAVSAMPAAATASGEVGGSAPDGDGDGVPVADRPRARTASGEIRLPHKRAQSIKPMLPEDSGPIITMEVGDENEPTGPRMIKPQPKRRLVQQPDPPELFARAGELHRPTAPQPRIAVTEEPLVVISEDQLTPARTVEAMLSNTPTLSPEEIGRPTIEIVDGGDSVPVQIRDRVASDESQPILLERKRGPDEITAPNVAAPESPTPTPTPAAAASKPGIQAATLIDDVIGDDDEGDVVILAARKAPRPEKRTQIGIAPPTTPRVHRDTDAVPMEIEDAPTSQSERDITRADLAPAPAGEREITDETLAAPPAPIHDVGDDTSPLVAPPPPHARTTIVGRAVAAASTIDDAVAAVAEAAADAADAVDAAFDADDADPDDDDDDDDGDRAPGDRSPVTAVMSVPELDAAVPDRAEVVPARARGRAIDYDDLDDGWGPPGTTIPPPLLGAVPGSDDDGVAGAIPLDIDSAPLFVGTAAPPEPSASGSIQTESGSLVRSLEESTARVIELIRALEHAPTRDSVVELMAAYLGESHRRTGFFSIKAGATKAGELGVFAMFPRPGALPTASMRLDRASTLQDIVGTRLPYRGPVEDDASRTFLTSVLGLCPPEILLVPVAVRERVVGVLYGEHRVRHTFDDQLALAARAAGLALERILKTRR